MTFFKARWELIKSAKRIPNIIARSRQELVIIIGENDFGIEIGKFKRNLAGPTIDITGFTVKVRARILSEKPSIVEEVQGYSWAHESTLFTNTCELTDPENGEGKLVISDTDLTTVGLIVCQIQTEDTLENKGSPGYFMFNLTDSFFRDGDE